MIDQYKIAFIICVNSEKMFQEAKLYISHLILPTKFNIEIIPIYNSESMTSGYNKGMKISDAKYKVYMHQDVYITNKKFIINMVDIFNKNKKIGMIGLAGSKYIPENGMWGFSTKKIGSIQHIYENYSFENSFYGEAENYYEEVKAIDGLLIVTQYDLFWCEDLFNGWHFYDLSQCVEFLKAGYKIVVPRQDFPWVMHECGVKFLDEKYEKYRKIFIERYFSFLSDN